MYGITVLLIEALISSCLEGKTGEAAWAPSAISAAAEGQFHRHECRSSWSRRSDQPKGRTISSQSWECPSTTTVLCKISTTTNRNGLSGGSLSTLIIQEKNYNCLLQPARSVTFNCSSVHRFWKLKYFFALTGRPQLQEKYFLQHHQKAWDLSLYEKFLRILYIIFYESFQSGAYERSGTWYLGKTWA